MRTPGRVWGERRARAAVFALALAACAARGPALQPLPPAPAMDAARLGRDVAWLADDARGGRGAGSAGLADAARYLARELGAAGFEPGGADGDYLQSLEMPVSIQVAREALTLKGVALEPGKDFGAFASSESGIARGEVVFAGYGITSPEHGWDDYADIDVQGRIALVLDDRPGGRHGPLAGPRGAGFLLRWQKVANARRHGAWAVLIAPSAAAESEVPGEAVRSAANPTTQASGVLALWVSRAAAERIATAGGGPSLAELQRAIDDSEGPASRVLSGVSVDAHVAIERRRGNVANVIGIREGSDVLLRHEAVVIGAHYDHLGLGPFGSLTPDRSGEVHNGADDNASGAAGLLELARAFGSEPPARRTLVLVAFAGEELGLAGSRAYVDDPVVPIADTIAMINLDMIGRLRERLTVFGTETSPGFSALVKRAAHGTPVEVQLGEGGYAPSDQTSFYVREVPVLFFFTGAHPEYHTPDDDAHLVDAGGEADVLRVVYRTARALLDSGERPQLVAAAPPASGGASPGYGPYLGTVPDFVATPGPGVRIQGVRSGSPAERAGLRAGDRIVEYDGASIANLEEFAALLFSSRTGESVEIVVLRAGERVTTSAILGRRR